MSCRKLKVKTHDRKLTGKYCQSDSFTPLSWFSIFHFARTSITSIVWWRSGTNHTFIVFWTWVWVVRQFPFIRPLSVSSILNCTFKSDSLSMVYFRPAGLQNQDSPVCDCWRRQTYSIGLREIKMSIFSTFLTFCRRKKLID